MLHKTLNIKNSSRKYKQNKKNTTKEGHRISADWATLYCTNSLEKQLESL